MPETLQQLVDRIGNDLQTLEDRLQAEQIPRIAIRFPRGFLRKASYFRFQYWFIRNENLKRNIAYSLILSDVFRWLLNRMDLWGTAREMVIKEGICLIGNICESITIDAMRELCKKGSFKKRTSMMVQNGIIDERLRLQLDSLWDLRNKEHLFLIDDREHNKYTLGNYNAAICALRELRTSLHNYFVKKSLK